MDNPELEKLKAEAADAKGWFEKYLNYIVAVFCFALGVIVGHII
jgi:hypothetical protein